MFSRREFLAVTGAAILAPPNSWAADKIPSSLDHILLGCSDLGAGISFVERHTGVRAVRGGVHPDSGTMNALLSLGQGRYFEIIAPDPKANAVLPRALEQLKLLKGLTTPRLTTWAVHTRDIDAMAKKCHDAGMAVVGPFPGSRTRPDGRIVSWKRFLLADNHHGVLPFFIEWNPDSVHPSVDSPPGCHIERFAAADQDPAESGSFAAFDDHIDAKHPQGFG